MNLLHLLPEMLSLLAAVGLAVLALPALVFAAQVLASSLLGLPPDRMSRPVAPHGRRPSVGVIVPAHNEESGLAQTLAALRPQLESADRLLVVADNCTDRTADVAIAAGAEVAVRADALRRGKGYALDHGLQLMKAAPPEVILIVDADCRVMPGAVERLVRRAHAEQVPIQSTYLMHAPAGARLGLRIAAFAMVVKNQVRPAGAAWMGLPCQLMGTGMAFPWPLLQQVSLATGHIVEDMQLGTELALAGSAPRFEPRSLVDSEFPVSQAGAATQRTRWEHGHLQVMLTQAPRLLLRGLVRGDIRAAALAADLLVPPLALLVMALVGTSLLAAGAALLGGWAAPPAFGLLLLALVSSGVLAAWWRFGRTCVGFGELLRAPAYVLGKVPVYARFVVARQSEWVRTRRRGE